MALTDSLKAHYKLDETSGSRADSHGSATLTDFNTTGYNTGVLGNDADPSAASNEYLNRLAETAFNIGANDDWTVAGWFKADNINNSWAPLFVLSNTGATVSMSLWRTSSPIFRFYYSDPSNASANVSSASLASGTWYFVVMWHDAAAETINLQINNGTPTTTSGLTNNTTTSTDGEVWIGWDGAYGSKPDMEADSVSIWNRTLTTQEKTDLYNGGAGLDYESFGASGAISGASALAFTQAATASASGALAGASALAFTQAATASASGALVGASDITFTPTATASQGDLSGASALAFTQAATLTASGVLAGAAALAFTPAATATQGALAGAAALTFTPAAALTASGALAGATTVTFAPLALTASGSITGATSLAFASAAVVRGFQPAGKPFLYTAANWSAPVFYLEVEFRATTGTALAVLKNETDNTFVDESEVSTTAAGMTQVRSSSFTLTDGATYRAHVGKTAGDAGAYKSAELLSYA